MTFTGGASQETISIYGAAANLSMGGGNGQTAITIGTEYFQVDGASGIDRLTLSVATRDHPGGMVLDMSTALGPVRMRTGAQNSFTGFERATVTGSSTADVILGGAGDDMITGRPGYFYNGFDVSLGISGLLDGGAGNDLVRSGFLNPDQADGHTPQDTLIGGVGNDTLQGWIGNDFLYGGTGNDVLLGGVGVGVDTMGGGSGDDVFVIRQYDSCTATGEVDNINLFVSHSASLAHHDRIDLSAIDADIAAAGNSACTFIGTATFTAPGQMQIGSSTFVEVNTTGTLDVELRIGLVGQAVGGLSVQDFIL